MTLEEPDNNASIVPTEMAQASRAIVGDTSIAEAYSFAGVHHVFEQHAGSAIIRTRFAHDERGRLAIAAADGSLSLCDVADGDADNGHLVLWLKGHSSTVTDFAWSQSNDLIASTSMDGSLRVWDANSGECVRVVGESGAPLLCVAFQPVNNNLVVLGSGKGALLVANISTGKLVKAPASCRVGGAATALACDNAGSLLWAGDDRGAVTSFKIDATSGKLAKGKRTVICKDRAVSSLSSRAWMSREARDPFLLISVAANFLALYRVTAPDGSLEFRAKFPLRHASPTSGVRSAFCPLMSFRQGACVLSGSEDSCVYLFDVEKGEGGRACVNKLQGHASAVTDVCFNQDESWLASGDSKGVVIIWKRSKPTARSPPPTVPIPRPRP